MPSEAEKVNDTLPPVVGDVTGVTLKNRLVVFVLAANDVYVPFDVALEVTEAMFVRLPVVTA